MNRDTERICGDCGHEFGKPSDIMPRMVDHKAASAKGGMVQRNMTTRRRPAGRVVPVSPSDVMTVDEVKAERKTGSTSPRDEVVSDDGHKKVIRRRKKRRRTAFGPLLFLGGWAILVMLVVILVKSRSGVSGSEIVGKESEEAERRAFLQEEMENILSKELPACHAVLLGFLKEGTWSGRAQFVRNPADVAPKMVRYYARNGMWKLPVGATVSAVRANLIKHSDDDYIVEAVFQVGFEPVKDENGKLAAEQLKPYLREVSFMPESNGWRIDWEALVRYSPNSWQLFRSDIDGNNGPSEFRLFVRRTTGRVEAGQSVMVLKFFEPREDDSEMWRQGSPPVVVATESESGRRLQEILERDPGTWEPGQPRLWGDDPGGLRRVRVRLYWETTADNRRLLKLGEVLAGNWLADGYEERFRDEWPAEGAEENPPKSGGLSDASEQGGS